MDVGRETTLYDERKRYTRVCCSCRSLDKYSESGQVWGNPMSWAGCHEGGQLLMVEKANACMQRTF